MTRSSYMYVIESESKLRQYRSQSEHYGRPYACDICGWKFRVRDIVFCKVGGKGGGKTIRRCALCYAKAFGLPTP